MYNSLVLFKILSFMTLISRKCVGPCFRCPGKSLHMKRKILVGGGMENGVVPHFIITNLPTKYCDPNLIGGFTITVIFQSNYVN